MLDIKFIKQNQEFVQKCFDDRKFKMKLTLDELIATHDEYIHLLKEEEDLNALRNTITLKIKKLDKKSDDFIQFKNQMQTIKPTIDDVKGKVEAVRTIYLDIMNNLPNILDKDVPTGLTEDDNVLIEQYGTPTLFNFDIKDHSDLELNGDLNFKAGATLAKSRFVVMRGAIAKLHRALIQFMLDEHDKKGYIEHNVPEIVNEAALIGTGQLPKFEKDLFQVGIEANQRFYLIPTAEVPLTNLYKNEKLTNKDLPLNMTAHSHCYRSEAGSYGQDVKGLIRQHQFEKVELVKIVDPETSMIELENITADAENILKKLNLPYQKILLCSGDTGFGALKTYDLEVWIPSQNKYREISSCSNTGDFQARRMGFKIKKDGKNIYPHTLNGSGLAVGRTLVAILENNQTEDGNIKVPEALKPYLNKEFLY